MNEEILKRLDVLGAKLGVTAQYLWGVLIRQARVEMWTDIGVVALSLIAAAAGVGVGIWAIKKDDYDTDPLKPIGFTVAGIALFIAAGYMFAAISEGVNPEYWALKQIMGALSK